MPAKTNIEKSIADLFSVFKDEVTTILKNQRSIFKTTAKETKRLQSHYADIHEESTQSLEVLRKWEDSALQLAQIARTADEARQAYDLSPSASHPQIMAQEKWIAYTIANIDAATDVKQLVAILKNYPGNGTGCMEAAICKAAKLLTS